jgi:hypothetical protein
LEAAAAELDEALAALRDLQDMESVRAEVAG